MYTQPEQGRTLHLSLLQFLLSEIFQKKKNLFLNKKKKEEKEEEINERKLLKASLCCSDCSTIYLYI